MSTYNNPRGIGFVLYDTYQSYDDAYADILNIPLSQYIIIGNENNIQDHGKIYQKINFNSLKYITRICGPVPSIFPVNVTLDYFNVSTDLFDDLEESSENNNLEDYLKLVINLLSEI